MHIHKSSARRDGYNMIKIAVHIQENMDFLQVVNQKEPSVLQVITDIPK